MAKKQKSKKQAKRKAKKAIKRQKQKKTQRQVPSQDTWHLLNVPMPEGLDPAGVVHLFMLLSKERHKIHHMEMLVSPMSPEEMAKITLRALKKISRENHPHRLLISSEALLESLQSGLALLGINSGIGSISSDAIESLYEMMIDGDHPMVSPGLFMGIKFGHEQLAKHTARIAACGAWDHLNEQSIFEISTPNRSLGWPFVSFIGLLGEQQGVVFYPSIEAMNVMNNGGDPARMLSLDMISLLLLNADESGDLICEAHARRGFPLHEESYPLLQNPSLEKGFDISDPIIIEEILASLEAVALMVEKAKRSGFPAHSFWGGEQRLEDGQIISLQAQTLSDCLEGDFSERFARSKEDTDESSHLRHVNFRLESFFGDVDFAVKSGKVSADLLSAREQEFINHVPIVPALYLFSLRKHALAKLSDFEAIETLILLAEPEGSVRILVKVGGVIGGLILDLPHIDEPLSNLIAGTRSLGGHVALGLAQGGLKRKKLRNGDILSMRLLPVEYELTPELIMKTAGVEFPDSFSFGDPYPEDLDPWQDGVADLLYEEMEDLSFDEDLCERAAWLWMDAAKVLSIFSGSEEIHAAAACYCFARISGRKLSQAKIAEAFGTNAGSVSKYYRILWKALELDTNARRYLEGNLDGPVPDLVLKQPPLKQSPPKRSSSSQTSAELHRYFELEITLWGSKPRVWRRILIDADATFAELHEAIQEGFDWGDCHLWEFREAGRRGEPIAGPQFDDPFGFGEPTPDAEEIEIRQYFNSKGDQLNYIYDFGDDWLHKIKLRKVVSLKESFHRRMVAGCNAGPPEDVGGVPGLMRFTELVLTGKDPWGEDADDLLVWLGDWHPHDFNLGDAQRWFNS